MGGQEYTYTATFDEEAASRFDKAVIRSNSKLWLFYGLEQSYRFALAGLIVSGGIFLFLKQGLAVGVAVALATAVGAVLGGLWSTLKALEDSQEQRDSMRGTSFEYTIHDDAFIEKSADGTTIRYPWETFRLLFEHPDGFLIDTSRGPIGIDRKPLVDAGLEGTFLARITHR